MFELDHCFFFFLQISSNRPVQTYYLHMRIHLEMSFKSQQLDYNCYICLAIFINEKGTVF